MKFSIQNMLFKMIGPTKSKVEIKAPSPLEAALRTKAADVLTKPLDMVTPQERKFMQAYTEMEKARLGIKEVKLNPKK